MQRQRQRQRQRQQQRQQQQEEARERGQRDEGRPKEPPPPPPDDHDAHPQRGRRREERRHSGNGTVLCHGCLEPYAPPQCACPCEGCGILRYCSPDCRTNDSDVDKGGQHTRARCRFVRGHCGAVGGIVQVGLADCDDVPLREYRYDPPPAQPRTEGGPSDSSEEGDVGSGGFATGTVPTPTGREFSPRVGDRAVVVLPPHMFDGGGSLLIRLLDDDDDGINHDDDEDDVDDFGGVVNGDDGGAIDHREGDSDASGGGRCCAWHDATSRTQAPHRPGGGIVLLCDVLALEPPTPEPALALDEGGRSEEEEVACAASELEWLEGTYLWYNDDLLGAMGCFRRSIDRFFLLRRSHDDDGHRDGDVHRDDDDAEVRFEKFDLRSVGRLPGGGADAAPPVRRDPLRTEVARRCHFLAMCLLDYDRPLEARKYLVRALRTKVRSDPFPQAISDLALSYEEVRDVDSACNVARWSADLGATRWVNGPYHRPGFVSDEVDYDGDDDFRLPSSSSSSSSRYFCESGHAWYPGWCDVLSSKSNYETIREEFFQLLLNKNGVNGDDVPPQHWPRVGGSHRQSGRDDDRVVNAGGDWREMVLFGSGGECPDRHVAPRTRALVERHAPDAVSLCREGGGEIIFSVLAPGTRVAPHCAVHNLRLTAHLGLVVPPPKPEKPPGVGGDDGAGGGGRCAIRVGDEWRGWEEGSFLVFDDSFEHEVVNDTDTCRAVLLLRFWHPSIAGARKRAHALGDIVRQREFSDRLRFVPPMPRRWREVERRGLGCTSCVACSRTGPGVVAAKLVEDMTGSRGRVSFSCSCGAPV